ncbi:FGGY-family carbohydrate kinase [Treponema sp. HNW]|uniref:xylulokinase n=1 Tax=Treponema sp. HNW TaxID=3116654 RepID=UPI003D0F0A5D
MIVVVDAGTSSLRVSLADSCGTIVYYSQKKYSLSYSASGSAEMDMHVFTEFLWSALEEAARYVKDNAVRIEGFAVTAQRSSVIAVDKCGNPLSCAVMWQDTRACTICTELKEEEAHIYSITGMRLSPVFSAPKMRWFKENKPDIYRKAYKLIGFCEYTLFQLCGTFATDTSIASRTSLFNIAESDWADELIALFGIEKEKLCPLIPVGSVAGKTTERISALYGITEPLPVISAGGDQQCAALGLGCISAGDVMINTGTGAFVLGLVDKPVYAFENGVSCNVSAINGLWVAEGSVLSAGKTLDWVNDRFFASSDEKCKYENFTQACSLSPPGANGLRFSVHFAGKGTPFWRPEARGALYGLNFNAGKNDIARAALEGIAAAVGECFACVEKSMEIVCPVVRISGGLAKDALFMHIQAAVLGRRIMYTQKSEATTCGAWISAACALGLYSDHRQAFDALSTQAEISCFESTLEEQAMYRQLVLELTSKDKNQFEETIYGKNR